ncbi:hypothetical protein BJY16_007068 [Actinoplanes octamycinicus]|uniref:Uncharacterized protein n=1 Tax=Actinoplanes octamycinicus TaxID=135948 RepID=A0A7W7H4E1_9ACTN|nr:hypothetical protein [Actinoplanes octamycinicus]MBB4743609.1 hypothetical protein [Actinoplanes octamycinicus]
MMTSADEVGDLLTGTMLADRPLGYGPRGTIMVQEIPPERVLEGWQAA